MSVQYWRIQANNYWKMVLFLDCPAKVELYIQYLFDDLANPQQFTVGILNSLTTSDPTYPLMRSSSQLPGFAFFRKLSPYGVPLPPGLPGCGREGRAAADAVDARGGGSGTRGSGLAGQEEGRARDAWSRSGPQEMVEVMRWEDFILSLGMLW